MTGHKDLKLADHYSKLDTEFQKEIAMQISDKIRDTIDASDTKVALENLPDSHENVVSFAQFREKRLANHQV